MQHDLSSTAVVPNQVEPIHPTWAVFRPESSTAVLSTLQLARHGIFSREKSNLLSYVRPPTSNSSENHLTILVCRLRGH